VASNFCISLVCRPAIHWWRFLVAVSLHLTSNSSVNAAGVHFRMVLAAIPGWRAVVPRRAARLNPDWGVEDAIKRFGASRRSRDERQFTCRRCARASSIEQQRHCYYARSFNTLTPLWTRTARATRWDVLAARSGQQQRKRSAAFFFRPNILQRRCFTHYRRRPERGRLAILISAWLPMMLPRRCPTTAKKCCLIVSALADFWRRRICIAGCPLSLGDRERDVRNGRCMLRHTWRSSLAGRVPSRAFNLVLASDWAELNLLHDFQLSARLYGSSCQPQLRFLLLVCFDCFCIPC